MASLRQGDVFASLPSQVGGSGYLPEADHYNNKSCKIKVKVAGADPEYIQN